LEWEEAAEVKREKATMGEEILKNNFNLQELSDANRLCFAVSHLRLFIVYLGWMQTVEPPLASTGFFIHEMSRLV
jgi:hypothetical protein